MHPESQSSLFKDLESIGGEPLDGSGFEHEQPEDAFDGGGDHADK